MLLLVVEDSGEVCSELRSSGRLYRQPTETLDWPGQACGPSGGTRSIGATRAIPAALQLAIGARRAVAS